MTTEKRPYSEVTILLVDDDDVDAMGVERALKKLKIANPVVRARDGVEGLELLRHESAVQRPYIVLLDKCVVDAGAATGLPPAGGEHPFVEPFAGVTEISIGADTVTGAEAVERDGEIVDAGE